MNLVYLYFYILANKVKRSVIIEIQTIYDNDLAYPINLYSIYNRPKKLYALGNVENLRRKCVAIVGCRDCSRYGMSSAKAIAFNLAKKNNVIVSGLAKGIDSFAHIGAIEANGRTIAVLGHGLNTIYPSENRELAKRIIRNGGTIITEYDMYSKIERDNFRARNRIISGLSSSIIVVEAKAKSGALITANLGLEQGKDVFAVPR